MLQHVVPVVLQLETIAQLRAQSVEVLLYSASRLSAYDEGYGTLFAYHLPSFVHAMHDDDWVIVAHPNEYAISHAHFNGERDYATATVHLYDFDEPADQVAKASMKTQSKLLPFSDPTQPVQTGRMCAARHGQCFHLHSRHLSYSLSHLCARLPMRFGPEPNWPVPRQWRTYVRK